MIPTSGNQQRRKVPGFHAFNRDDPWIYLGTRALAKMARSKRGSMVAPMDLDPASVWWPVEGIPVVLVIGADDKAQEAARLAGCLTRDGAQVVLCLGERGLLSRHQREAK